MSDLSPIEKRTLETLLGMNSGYVLDFSNRTFHEFIIDSIGIDIYDAKYEYGSGSKANRLRALWKIEQNHIVGKVLKDMLDMTFPNISETSENKQQIFKCRQIIDRLLSNTPVLEVNSISSKAGEEEFSHLAKAVKEAIDKNEFESGLDRLHTFCIKYIRQICTKRGINTDKDKPLHSLLGEYIKNLKSNSEIDSEMTERILKSSISTLESFNKVSNDHSLAHDNNIILNYEESLLIFNYITSSIRFIEAIENKRRIPKKTDNDFDDIPF